MAKKVSINSLLKSEEEEIYVINTSATINGPKRGASNVTFDVSYGNGQQRSVTIYASWVPQDLTSQASKSAILESPSFRDCIDQGWAKLVPNDEAETLLEDEDAVLEVQRLKSRHRAVNTALGVAMDTNEKLPKGLSVEKDAENGNVTPVLVDLCARDAEDIDHIEVYSKLRNLAPTMTLEDALYAHKNLPAGLRNAKINKFLNTKIEELTV
jgi:hypothetical protein